jgi:hypothetical protein
LLATLEACYPNEHSIGKQHQLAEHILREAVHSGVLNGGAGLLHLRVLENIRKCSAQAIFR